MARRWKRWTIARRFVQASFFCAAFFAAVRVITGTAGASLERFCPFGGLETAWSVATSGHLSCATGEHNLTLMAALLVSALLVRKAFCSWICPVGAISEWLASAGPSGLKVPRRVDGVLRWLRLPVLAAVLAGTALTGELVFRTFDPYYVVFNPTGHDVHAVSWVMMGVLAIAALLVPMAWCRWLCPLGAALWPASRVSRLRIVRDAHDCTGCGSCDSVCPHSIPISSVPDVRSGECTLCLECAAACPGARGALSLRGSPAGRRLAGWIVPAVLTVLAALGLASGSAIAIPSFTRDYTQRAALDQDARPRDVTLMVDGIRCVDTARRASDQLAGVPGVVRFRAYASRGTARIEFDGTRTSVEDLRRALEAPVLDEPSGEWLFRQYVVVEIDGRPIDLPVGAQPPGP